MFRVSIWLLLPSLLLLSLGLILIASSSLHIAYAHGLGAGHYFEHQLIYFSFGLFACLMFSKIEIFWLRQHALKLFLFTCLALIIVLVPGIGHQVNGSMRWIHFGPISIQVSEFMKLVAIVYVSDLLLRNANILDYSLKPHLSLCMVWAVLAILLLKEPDFGSFVVILLSTASLWFLIGCRLRYVLIAFIISGVGITGLVMFAPYRLQRLTTFFHPWEHAFDSGYQLTQSLIAFGRGGFWGQGLGGGLQKQFYLPEAHTDFLYAVLCEELGLIAGLFVIALFLVIIFQCLILARNALRQQADYHALLVFGIAIWFSVQVFINLSVNMGILPTKGLTLPFMSYGGSSLLVSMLALALVLKIEYELRSKPKLYLKTVSNWRQKL